MRYSHLPDEKPPRWGARYWPIRFRGRVLQVHWLAWHCRWGKWQLQLYYPHDYCLGWGLYMGPLAFIFWKRH